jgi:hypothetical protein
MEIDDDIDIDKNVNNIKNTTTYQNLDVENIAVTVAMVIFLVLVIIYFILLFSGYTTFFVLALGIFAIIFWIIWFLMLLSFEDQSSQCVQNEQILQSKCTINRDSVCDLAEIHLKLDSQILHINKDIISGNYKVMRDGYFKYKEKIYYEQSINPRIVYMVENDADITNNDESIIPNPDKILKADTTFKNTLPLTYRELKIHSSPILINYSDNDYYLAIGKVNLFAKSPNNHNHHFFYIFESCPPFKILGMSKSFKFETRGEPNQFVVSFFLKDNNIYISHGDSENKSNKISIYDFGTIMKMIDYNY